MHVNSIQTVELTSLSHDGRAVGRLVDDPQGRVIFVTHALPGQVVQAKITKSKKNFAEAQCMAIIQEAAHSQEAPCAHAQDCGGCPLQTLHPTRQLYWKERMVHEAMARIAKLAPEQLTCMENIVPSPQAWGYRNKMEFAFGNAHNETNMPQTDASKALDKTLALGLRAKASHAVIAVPQCLLMPPVCLNIVESIRALCQKAGFSAWPNPTQEHAILRHVIIRRSRTSQKWEQQGQGHAQEQNQHPEQKHEHEIKDALQQEVSQGANQGLAQELQQGLQQRLQQGKEEILVNLIIAPSQKEARLRLSRLGQELMQLHPEVTGFILEERYSKSMVAQGQQKIFSAGNLELQESLGPVAYTFGHNAFFQINTPAAAKLCTILENMTQDILQGQKGSCLWDVYCGVGAPGLTLAPYFETMYGVEINDKAIAMAQKNAVAAGYTHCQYTAGDAKDILLHWPQPHMILLDPPRAGLHEECIQQMLQASAKAILYISCNPATLARDIAALSPQYTVQKLVPLDFFPQTAHVESCALLVRR